MANKKLIVPIIADPEGFKRGLAESSTAASKFEGHIKGVGSSVVSNLALMGGALLGAGSVVEGLKKSIDAAQELNVSTRALNAQLRANSENVKMVDSTLGGLTLKMTKLGYTNSQTEQAFTRLDRASGSAAAATKYMGVTADLAAAKHLDLAQAALLVGKVMTGTTSALNRYGIAIPKGVSATEALAIASQKLAGQAQAAVTPQKQFSAVLTNMEAVIGKALLPTVDKYLSKLTDWFGRSANQKKITDDVRAALSALKTTIETVVSVFQAIDKVTGSFGNTLKIMGIAGAAAFVAIKVAFISTGVGAALIGLGLAAGYVITHWAQVKSWMLDFWGWMKTGWRDVVDVVKGLFYGWVAAVIGYLKLLADGAAKALGWLPGIGGKLKAAARAIDGFYTDFKSKSDKAFSDIGKSNANAWSSAYMANVQATGGRTGTRGPRAPGTGVSPLTVQSGQQVFLDYLKQRGWTPDQIAQAQRLINYEDASGRAGDKNTSFGPRQLHVGGQLPASVAARGPAYAQQWAWSQQGLTTAAAGIAGFGNLHGSALAQALANKQGSSNIPKEAAAILGRSTPVVLTSATSGALPGDKVAADAALKKRTDAQNAASRAAFKAWHDNYFTPLDNQYKRDLLIGDESKRLTSLKALLAKFKAGELGATKQEKQALFNEETKVEGKIQSLRQKMANAAKALLAKQHADFVKSLQDNLNAAQTSLARQQTLFDRGWSRIVAKITSAFNAATQAGLAAIQMKAGGPTPQEQALKAFQDQMDAAQKASDMASAQSDLAAAQLSGDPAAVQAAQAHLGDVQNAQKLADLQAAADQSRTLANAEADKQTADYQAARDAQLENLNNWLDDQKTSLEAGTVTWDQFWQGAFSDAPSKYAPDAVTALQGIIDQQQRILSLQGQIDGSGGGGGLPGGQVIMAGAQGRSPIGGFASGGLVPGALGAPMLAVVHGGETVVPAGGGGGVTVNVTVQGALLGSSVPEVAKIISAQINRDYRRGTGLLGTT